MQTNIVIDSNLHPRPLDHGVIAIMPDPNNVDPSDTAFPSADTLRYMAPELICPGLYDLEDSNPTKKSDIYAFGVVAYQVSIAYCTPPMMIQRRRVGGYRRTAFPRNLGLFGRA